MKLFFNTVINTKKVHLDFASTTPVAREVQKNIEPFWSKYFFNPSASYTSGQNLKKIIKKQREDIARYIGVKDSEVIFTQGGTESINLALIGYIKHIKKTVDFCPHIIISTIEHPAVSLCIEYIQTLGVEIEHIPVLQNGSVDVQTFEKMLKPTTVLVSVIGASNETGVIQPIHKISSSIKKYKNSLGRIQTQYPFVHSDVSQMVLTQNISISKLGVDMLTVDGSKIYAPKMAGLLIKKNYVELEPIIYGGGQEFGLRSGTESLHTSVGIATAFACIQKKQKKDSLHFDLLKKFFIFELNNAGIPFEINGSGDILPNIFNICIKGLDSEYAVIQMDEYGINCASMSSCASLKNILESEVLRAMGKSECAGSSLRFSFGRTTTKKDIKKAVRALEKVCMLQRVI